MRDADGRIGFRAPKGDRDERVLDAALISAEEKRFVKMDEVK